MCPMLRNLRTTTSGAWQSNWTTHTQNTAGMSQVYPNLESYVYIVIYIESCNVMHIWSLFTSDGSVAISKCSAKASCTSSAPRLLPLEDLFPAKFASNFSKNYMVSLLSTMRAWPSQHMPTITTSHGILLASMTFFLSTTGAFSYFPQMSLFPLPDSQTPRLHAPGLPDSAWSCWAFCRPSSSACCFLKSFSSHDKTTNWRQIYPGWRCSESWSFLLLITSSCKSNLQQQSQSSQSPLSDDLESTCHWVFPKIDFVKFHFDPFGLSDLSDLSPNLQDFPGLLAFHESTISSNKPLQYLPCGHAMLFSLFGIWELNSLKSSEQCSNYENLWIHRWGESFTCGEPQTAKEWINNVGHLMYICSAILRLPSGRFAFWRLCISWLKFF